MARDSLGLGPNGGPDKDDGKPAESKGPPPNLFVQAHLTQPADANGQNCVVLSEGTKIPADAKYVKVAEGPQWLEIGALGATERAVVVGWLEASGGVVTSNGKGRLVIGEAQTTHHFGADTESAESVLKGANDRAKDGHEDAALWQYLNGGEEVLHKEDASRDGWKAKQKKPGSRT